MKGVLDCRIRDMPTGIESEGCILPAISQTEDSVTSRRERPAVDCEKGKFF